MPNEKKLYSNGFQWHLSRSLSRSKQSTENLLRLKPRWALTIFVVFLCLVTLNVVKLKQSGKLRKFAICQPSNVQGWVEGVLKEVLYGEVPPWGQTHTLLWPLLQIIFDRESNLNYDLLLKMVFLSHTYYRNIWSLFQLGLLEIFWRALWNTKMSVFLYAGLYIIITLGGTEQELSQFTVIVGRRNNYKKGRFDSYLKHTLGLTVNKTVNKTGWTKTATVW